VSSSDHYDILENLIKFYGTISRQA